MLADVSQSMTFYLNAYEIRPEKQSRPLDAFRIPPDNDVQARRRLASILRENNITFHRLSSDYLGYKAGYYIYDVERWSQIIKSDEILSKIECYKEHIEATSYVVRNAILKLIEDKLGRVNDIRKIKNSIDERKFYFLNDLLKDNSSIFTYHRCFVYRVEYFAIPTKKLLLLILPSLLIKGKKSLEWLIKEKNVPTELLLGLPFKVEQEINQEIRTPAYVGFLEDLTDNTAIVRPADLTLKTVEVPLKNLYAIGRIDLYRKIVEFLGENCDLLYDYKGEFTFTWEKRKKIENAPSRMKEEVENIRKELFSKNVFPLKLQSVTYTLSDDPVSLESREE